MKHRRISSVVAAVSLTATSLAGGAASAQAGTDQQTLGHRSLAKVLAADGHQFDKNSHDFDIVDKFVLRVLTKKPDSELAILTHGRKRLTAFLPTDGAFRRAAEDIVGKRFGPERRVFRSLWRAGGTEGVENVLLYHLVPGRTLTYHRLGAGAPMRLTTLQGGKLRVRVHDDRVLVLDRDPESPRAHVIRPLRNINKGNRQIAHGVSSLLSPVTP